MEIALTPLDFLERARRLFADRIGVIDGDHEYTYAEFGRRCDQHAAMLQHELGIRPGDVVAWLCGNTHELLEAYYGVLRAGAVLLPVNVRLSPTEMRHVLDDSRAAILFRHPDQPDPQHSVRTVLIDSSFDDALRRHAGAVLAPLEIDERDAAEIFYTSGSTGLPKGAVLTHRSLYLHAVHSALTSQVTGDDVILHTIPLFHVNGWGVPHYLTMLGGQHVMLPRFDATEVLRLIQKHRATRLNAVPTMMRMILDHPSRGDYDLSSLTHVLLGGSPPGASLMAEVEAAFGCPCLCGYGMTEAGPSLTRSVPKPGTLSTVDQRASTGWPIIGVDVRVFDDTGNEVPWDDTTVGEICARSNHIMREYVHAPEATAKVIVDGWLRTGDLAVVRPDGYLRLVDRKKDLIISGGENIATPEVEAVLALHPAVREVSVVGVTDERWGEVPRAFVVLVPGGALAADELVTFARERLAHFKVPRDIVFLDQFPISGTGKISKVALRDWPT